MHRWVEHDTACRLIERRGVLIDGHFSSTPEAEGVTCIACINAMPPEDLEPDTVELWLSR